MKTYLKYILLFFLVNHLNAQKHDRKSNQNTEIWRYEIECAGVGGQGSKLVKVWSYLESPKASESIALKNAVHGIVFKGYSGGVQGCSSFRPLVRDAEVHEEHKRFFKNFFQDGGMYLKFVTSATEGMVDAGDVFKIGKKKFKVGIVVSVQTELLRRHLEKNGIISGLSSGF